MTKPNRRTVPGVRDGNSRTQARREKAAALRTKHAAQERRRRNLIGGIIAAVVLALIVTIGIAIQTSRNSTDGPTTAPRGLTADGGYTVGQADAPVEIEVYEDFQCPACAAFEQQIGPTVTDLVDAGDARVTYYPIAFLDRASTDRYSTRALNSTACVIDTAPQSFPAFHDALFANQPAEGGPGLSNDQLISLAVDAGADREQITSCVDNLTFENWTRQVTDAVSRAGINQTPTVLVNGQPLTARSPAGLRAAVQAAQKK